MKDLFRSFVLFAFGDSCALCDEATGGPALCSECRKELPFPFRGFRCRSCFEPLLHEETCQSCIGSKSPISSIRSLWSYRDTARSLMHEIKYGKNDRLCTSITKEVARQSIALFEAHDWDYLVPIPSFYKRITERGYNQSALIANELSRALRNERLRREEVMLMRSTRSRPMQSHIRGKKRISNVRDAFYVHKSIANKKILLIDDVLTTGATALSAAQTLSVAGACRVDLFTLARSDNWITTRKETELAILKKTKYACHQ